MKNEKLQKIAREIISLENDFQKYPERQEAISKTLDKIMGKLSLEEMMLIDDYILSEQSNLS